MANNIKNIARWSIVISIALLTILWVAFFVGFVSQFTYPFGWWAVLILVILGMLILNLLYFIMALPSLLMFFIKERSRNQNYTISIIYIIGMLIAVTVPWLMIIEGVTVSKIIIAVAASILVIIFYKRKISELFEPD